MNEEQFHLSDNQILRPLNDNININLKSHVKEEEIDEEDALLFHHLDSITNEIVNNADDLQIVQDMEILTSDQPGPSNEHILKLSDGQNFDRLGNCIKRKIGDSHFVKYKIEDGKQVKTWECATCSKEFGHQYTLVRHLPTHTNERKFQCKICGKAFRQMCTLAQHRAIHFPNRPYVCGICEKTFNRVSTLISHRKIHSDMKLHQCHLCNKAFHQKGNLKNHIFTHTNARPYKCDLCNKGFNQLSNLMCHKVKTHNQVEKHKYVCNVCGKGYNKLSNAQSHEHFIEIPKNESTETAETVNTILVDTIQTEAMRLALESNRTPFALLRPLVGIPVLVRVLPATGDKQMLLPATAEDLKQHAQVSIITKDNNEVKNDSGNGDNQGSTVQIKVPVVATIIQQNSQSGELCLSVVSPGPWDE